MTVAHPELIQLYSAKTPNGIKAAMALEELVFLRSTKEDFNYEPHTIDLRRAESRKGSFLEINPNGKIPAIHDPHGPGGRPVTVWESGAILLYLAEKYNELLPTDDPLLRVETIKWLFWGSTAVSSQIKAFGFYFKYCTHKMPYCVSRYAKECDRLLTVLENRFQQHGKHYVVGDEFTIADIAIWPWVYALTNIYDNAVETVFNDFKEYPKVAEWHHRVLNRPATQRALNVTPFVS